MGATAGYMGLKKIRAIICAKPLHTNNPSIGLSIIPINQYGRHRGVRGLQADQGDHLCRAPQNQQFINRSVCQNYQSIWAPPKGMWASSRSGRSSVPSPCTTNNPSICLSAKPINQYGRHRGVRGLQADQGDHLCRAPAHRQSINRSVYHTNQSIWAPPRGTRASSRSGQSSVPSPCTTNNPSIGLSAKLINQYGRHQGVRGLQADQGDHLC
jgi:hypothetical protein